MHFYPWRYPKIWGTRGCFKGSRKATTSIKVQGGLRIPVGIPRYLRFDGYDWKWQSSISNYTPVFSSVGPMYSSVELMWHTFQRIIMHMKNCMCTILHCVWLIIHSKIYRCTLYTSFSRQYSKHITPPNHTLINYKLQLKQYKQYEFIHHRCR